MNKVKLTNELFFYECINGSLPNYLYPNEHLLLFVVVVINNKQRYKSADTCMYMYASYKYSVYPNSKHGTEGGRSFPVSPLRL